MSVLPMPFRRYIIVQVLLASIPVLLLGLGLAVNFLQQGFDSVNRVHGELQTAFEQDAIALEGEVRTLTDDKFERSAKLEAYEAQHRVAKQKMELQRRAIEARGAIVGGAVVSARQLVTILAARPGVSSAEIHSVLTGVYGHAAMSVSFWRSRQELAAAVATEGYSRDFAGYAAEAFTSGAADWFEDEVGAKDIAVSLVPLRRAGRVLGVYCLVFDLSESYAQLDEAERLGLSITSARIQEQRLREVENHKRQLQEKREAQRRLIAGNKQVAAAAVTAARNWLMLFMGATMALLIGLSLFLFYWLGTRRITGLKNWLAEVTEGNLAAGAAGGGAIAAAVESGGIDDDEWRYVLAETRAGAGGRPGPALRQPRIVVTSPDEIGELGRSINVMLDSLDRTTVSKNLLLHEIEERKTVERKLWEHQQRLATILDAVQAGVVLIEAESRIIVEINPAAARMIGGDKEEIVGRMCYGSLCPGDRLGDDPGQRAEHRQVMLVTGGGEELPIIKTAAEVVLEGRKHFIVSFVDITELQEARRQLEETTRAAEHASRVKSQFLANMSHEIRTPLNGVLGMSELALDTDLDEHQRTIVATIAKEGGALLRIINDILDFSKIEAGRLELEEIPFDPYSLCEEVVQAIIYGGEQKGIEIVFFIDPAIPPSLCGDPGRIRQILMNLCNNALKFTSEGEIYIKVELGGDQGDRARLLFSIRDTGIGIAPEKLARIFESFTQADGSTTRLYGGTGLGTAISKQLVEMMGGWIVAESVPGQGSTFSFELPLAKAAGEQPLLPAATANLQGLRVLIVDDNPTNLFILEEYLNSWGCIPKKAGNGREALAMFQEELSGITPVDLVITDYNMPVMDGFAMIGEMRRMAGSGRGLPVIVLSSSNSRGQVRNWAELAIAEYITKPILRRDLLAAVHRALEGGGRGEVRPAAKRVAADRPLPESCCRILLAEDYPTNRMVAISFLAKAGFRVDAAENGRQAVELFRRHRYDLVLMDIQMPELDGYGATRDIRAIEAGQPGALRIPIIAMTAHAMKGYREKCIAGGMDDYLAKPLQRRDLLAMVGKWLPEITMPEAAAAAVPEQGESNGPPVDLGKLLDEMGGDEAIVRELFACFATSLASQQPVLADAVAAGDCETVRKEAHAIKGAALNVAAGRLAATARALEQSGSAREVGESRSLFAALTRDIDDFMDFAGNYRGG